MKPILSRTFICASDTCADYVHQVPAPYLRRNFELEEIPQQALLSVCGLGFYEVWVNGVRITKGLLSPYISNPDQVLDYDVYAIAPYLKTGRNTLAFQLGNGMQNAWGGYIWDFEKASFRSAPKLAVWCGLQFADGSEMQFEADPRFVTAPSPLLADDLRGGEVYDARLEIPGWNTADFDDSGWQPALLAEPPKGEPVVCRAKPIVASQILHPVAIRPDTLALADRGIRYTGYLYDFGVNAAGVPVLRVNGNPGQQITMIFGEYIGADGHLQVQNIRFDFLREEYKNLPAGLQKDEYICKGGGEEVWSPHFTYHGFRYALVVGLTPEQATQTLLQYAVMHTDLGDRGGFDCSEPVLNQLQQMTRRSILANFYHFPTDCPHREKNGWTADAALSAEACLLNFDPRENYREWLGHIRAAMREDGSLPGIVPTAGWGFHWGNGPAWDQVLVTLTDLLYRFSGERDVIIENADAILRYCRYIDSRRDEKGLLAIGLGDWCAPHGEPKAPLLFTDSVISMDIARKAAFLLAQIGKTADSACCAGLAASLRTAVRKYLLTERTAVGNCQTSQAMGLFYGIFEKEEEPAAYQVLLSLIHEQNDHIDCGVLGARVLFRVLSDFGDADLALKILLQPDAPSYGNWVARGETSLCEDFAPYEEHVNSLNHHFFGDISAWFMEYLGGIRPNPASTEKNRVDIAPVFPASLSYVHANHCALCGLAESSWERRGGEILLRVKMPEKGYGVIRLPKGFHFADGRTVCPAASGEYAVYSE